MWKRVCLVCGLCLLLSGCSETTEIPPETDYDKLLEEAPVVQIIGDTLSPDGKYDIRTEGKSEHYVSGERVPEQVQIVERESGEPLWSIGGGLNLSALWSEDSQFVALTYGGRTWNAVRFIETEKWTSTEFRLPEYSFLREGWGQWVDENSLEITAENGENVERYRCSVVKSSGGLESSVVSWTCEVMNTGYDVDHDGEPESPEIVTFRDTEEGWVAWYELRIGDWTQEAAEAHVGWTSIFALELDGQDYLLRYDPYMGQGAASYSYQIFSLDENGEEVPYLENSVEFDINFGSPVHQSYDPAVIAAFLEEVHWYLDRATLLISTEGGEFAAGGSGADFSGDDFCGGKILASDDWETALREYQEFAEAERE